MRRGVLKAAAVTAWLGIACVTLVWVHSYTGSSQLVAVCGGNILVQAGFKVHCDRASLNQASRVAVTSLALKNAHKDLAQVHRKWCEDWCVIERTHADCSSCVQPSFPGYMAHMKATEQFAQHGWGIHIPTKEELKIGQKAVQHGHEEEGTASKSAEEEAVTGFKASASHSSLGDLSPEQQAAGASVMGRDTAGKQALYQLQAQSTKEMTMESMEQSEVADERRLKADEKRLARDRAIKQRLQKLRAQKMRKLNLQERSTDVASFLATRRWHRDPSPAAAVSPSPAHYASARKPNTLSSGHAARDKPGKERQASRRSVADYGKRGKGAWMSMHLRDQVKLPKLQLAPQYLLPGDFAGGLPEPIEDSRQHSSGPVSAPRRAANGRVLECHTAYDCFGSLFHGDGARFVTKVPTPAPRITDPKSYIKGQGLGCHSLGDCMGSFFGGRGSGAQAAATKAPKKDNTLLSSHVNLDGWSTAQFTKGLEHGINLFPPDQKDALLQVGGGEPRELVALEQLGDGGVVGSGFFADEAVAQEMGEAPATSCCGGDATVPLAAVGRAVYELGQNVKRAEIWEPMSAGLEGITPMKGAEPVIKTGQLGVEPAPMPRDPTGTGRFGS